MKKFMEISAVIVAVLLAFGIYVLLACGISWGLAFAFGIHFGVLQTMTAMVLIEIASNLIFGGLKRASKGAK